MKPFNNIINSIVVVAMMATLTTACTHESGLVNDPGLCLVTNIDVALDAGTNPTRASGDNGAIVRKFAAGDVINIGSTTMKASYKTDGSLEWKMQGNLYIDKDAIQPISASYTPAADVKKAKADGHSIYYDHLTATASKEDGTITVDLVNLTATITLNFKHVNSVATLKTVTDADDNPIAANLITAIDLILTEGDMERKVAIRAVGDTAIVPAGALLTAVEITPRYQTPIAAKLKNPHTVKANKKFSLAVTLTGQNTATVAITDESITSWMPEDVKIPEGYDYAIFTADDLVKLAAIVYAGDNLAGKKIIQMGDIDISGIENWMPIGTYINETAKPFSGLYNGNGYAVIGLTIKSEDQSSVGLFGYVAKKNPTDSPVLVNIHLRNANVYGMIAGALAGRADDCVIAGCSSSGIVGGVYRIGGLVGQTGAFTSITRSRSSCSTTSNKTAGGLVGANYRTILGCSASGRIIAPQFAGGLVGENYGPVFLSYANGYVRVTDRGIGQAGGLLGHNTNQVSNCYSKSTIVEQGYWGHLVGFSSGGSYKNCNTDGRSVGGGSSTGIISGSIVRNVVVGEPESPDLFKVKTAYTNGLSVEEVEVTYDVRIWTTDNVPTIKYNYRPQ